MSNEEAIKYIQANYPNNQRYEGLCEALDKAIEALENKHRFTDNCEYEVIKPHEFCPRGGLDITWYSDSGFGHYTVVFDENGRPVADSECMDRNDDKRFTKALFEKFAEEIDVKR